MAIKIKRIKEILKPKYYKQFIKFMNGQTITVIETDNPDDEWYIFEDDFWRWINKLPVVD